MSTTTRSLDGMMRPRSIAVVGASERGPGATLSRNLARLYSGETYFVNPNRPSVFDQPTVPTLAELPGPVDLAAIAVGPERVLDAVAAAGAAGIKNAIVLTPGFGETGDAEGAQRELQLRDVCATHGIAMCGPNCLGIMTFVDRCFPVAHDLTGPLGNIATGPVAIVSQSGGVLISLLSGLMYRHIGLSYVVSSGSEFNVGVHDYLDWLAKDQTTGAIGLVVEGLNDGPAFLRAATRALADGKPVVVMKLGRSREAAAAVQAHTGKLAGDVAVFRAACRQYGIGYAEDLEEFAETLVAFSGRRPLPRGPRLAAAMISGGAATLVVDACDRESGLELAAVQPETSQQLRALLPGYATVSNPLDITGGSTIGKPEIVTGALGLLGADPHVDLTAYVCPFKPDGGPVAPLIERVIAHASSAAKPTFVISMNANALGHYWRNVIDSHDATVLQGFRPAMRALGHVAGAARATTAAGRRLSSGALPISPGAALSGRSAVRALPYSQARSLLERYGFTFPRHITVTDETDLKRVADELGFPVVLKAFSPDVSHKTEAGAVRLGITDADVLIDSFAELAALASDENWRDTELVVEEMLDLGAEFILGVSSDATFGQVAVAGAGGLLAELLPTAVSLALPPLQVDEAVELVSANSTLHKLVSGFRGPALRDLTSLPRLLAALARLAQENPTIRAVDVNPIAINARTGELVAVDALIEAVTLDNIPNKEDA